MIGENVRVSLPSENPEFHRRVPKDDDRDDYLLASDLTDATVHQIYTPPNLPSAEEVTAAVQSAETLLEAFASELDASPSEPGRLKSEFEQLVQLLSRVDREFFEQPCFGESPIERLHKSTLAAELVVSDLANAQRLLRKLCSKNAELVTHQFFAVVLHHLQRTTHWTSSGHVVVVLEDQTPENTYKEFSQLREDCSLAADQLIRGAGFSCSLPTSSHAETAEDTAEGFEHKSEELSREAYVLRRDDPEVPTIDLGSIKEGITRQHAELVADALKQVALAELLYVKQHGFKLATSLSLSETRAVDLRSQLQPYRSLSDTADRLSVEIAEVGVSAELSASAQRAYQRMRATDLRFSQRVISDESVAAAKAKLERAEQIRFTAARLLARGDHPAIKYVGDPVAQEISAIAIATELVDSGKHIQKL